MKLKLYSLVFTLLFSLAAFNISFAQIAEPAPPAQPVGAVPPVPPNDEVGVHNLHGNLQDTGFSNKMRKLREQVRVLNKEIADMTREQSKKISAFAQEQAALVRKSDILRFDADFGKNIAKAFSNQSHTGGDETRLQKQVADGDVKEKGKTFTKTYPVNTNDRLQIDNRYGKIAVNTWAKNEIKVDVDIKAYSLTDAEAQKLLDETSVKTDKDASGVNFSTNIEQSSGSWWGSSTNNGRINKLRKVTINYTVYMPAKNALTITNRYGTVTLPDLAGKVTVNNTYGSLTAKALTNSDNNITVKYGDADITSVNGSDITVAYGKLALGAADKLNANISYSTVKIGKLNTSADINVKYGDGVVLDELGKQLRGLTINSSYASVKIGSTDETNADFDVTVHYASFLHDNTAKITSQTPDKERGFTSTKIYKGQLGKGNTDNVIKVNTKYGNVRFN